MIKKTFLISMALLLVFAWSNSAMAVPIGGFLSWSGDTSIPGNDDGSSPQISLSTSFWFFGQEKNSLWVNNNGNITFDGSLYSYTPESFPGPYEIVAAYWGDVDTRGTGSGLAYYGERTDDGTLTTISNQVNTAFSGAGFAATYAFVASWDHVGYYSYHADMLNTFQIVLATDGGNSYAIFNYLDDGMSWETGDASGGSGGFGGTEAAAGFDAGDSTNYYTIPGSFYPGIANVLEDGSNTGVAGRWVFRISEEEIEPAPISSVPLPGAVLLLGSGLMGLFGLRRRIFG